MHTLKKVFKILAPLLQLGFCCWFFYIAATVKTPHFIVGAAFFRPAYYIFIYSFILFGVVSNVLLLIGRMKELRNVPSQNGLAE